MMAGSAAGGASKAGRSKTRVTHSKASNKPRRRHKQLAGGQAGHSRSSLERTEKMILADKIIELRKKNGWSQEELAEMLGVSRQSVSKWEGAQSVPDMNRILKLSEVFGVSTDELLKDDLELPAERPVETVILETRRATDIPEVRNVSMEEAVSFLDFRNNHANRVSIGVMVCILSPVLLILLSGAQEAGMIALSENQAGGIGLVVLLLMVTAAVAVFVLEGIRGSGFEYFEKEAIETAYGVDGMARERRERFRGTYTWQMVAGIALCVVAAIPLFVTMIAAGDNEEFVYIASLALLLVLVAIGVFMIVRCSIVWDGFHMLLQEGEFTPARKEENRKNELLETVYWCSVIAIYLAYSFITGRWDRSWIVWPVAGVFYGAVKGVAGIVRKRG